MEWKERRSYEVGTAEVIFPAQQGYCRFRLRRQRGIQARKARTYMPELRGGEKSAGRAGHAVFDYDICGVRRAQTPRRGLEAGNYRLEARKANGLAREMTEVECRRTTPSFIPLCTNSTINYATMNCQSIYKNHKHLSTEPSLLHDLRSHARFEPQALDYYKPRHGVHTLPVQAIL